MTSSLTPGASQTLRRAWSRTSSVLRSIHPDLSSSHPCNRQLHGILVSSTKTHREGARVLWEPGPRSEARAAWSLHIDHVSVRRVSQPPTGVRALLKLPSSFVAVEGCRIITRVQAVGPSPSARRPSEGACDVSARQRPGYGHGPPASLLDALVLGA
jgi:hypothetical protein